MGRKWIEGISPQVLHERFGIYQGEWMPQMDRCWMSEDGEYSVLSRLLRTDMGKVEHVTIQRIPKNKVYTSNGENDIPWNEKMAIKNELFGEKRVAIEIFPSNDRLVDVMDVYHLWVFEKGFQFPFGIHPKDKKCSTVKRGNLPITEDKVKQLMEYYERKDNNNVRIEE